MIEGYILKFQDVTADIRIVTIQMPKDQAVTYHAGQYAAITIEGCDPRFFSIANAPRADNTLDIHIRNTGGAVSAILCSTIREGQPVHVSMPHGTLKLSHTHAPKIFLAGGTGITPFLAMVDSRVTNAPIHLFWGMEKTDDFYTRPQQSGLSVTYCTDVYPVDAFLENPVMDAEIYLSGPPAMVHDSCVKLLAAGFDPSNIFYDES